MSVAPLPRAAAKRAAPHDEPGRPALTPVALSRYVRCKPWIGRLAALVLLAPALPLIVLMMVVVPLTSRGWPIYRQVRVGREGKLFTIYKVRTMRRDAEAATGPVWSLPGDPRITLVGRFLRWSHLDELPQLFNVLRGDMCLVGPRPERPEIVRHLVRQIPGYLDRLAITPGITGLAQVNLPPDSDLASVRRKLALDLRYLQIARPLLDLRLVVYTALRAVKFPHRAAWWLCRLEPVYRKHRILEEVEPWATNGHAEHNGAAVESAS